MYAIQIDPGNTSLHWVSTPTPEPKAGEVRIKVRCAGVNRADLLQRNGQYPPPPGASDILGLEVSGHIDAIGQEVSRWKEGDAVCALLTGGGYAEYVTVPAGQVLPIPAGVSLEDAAAIPETFATVWQTLHDRARLQAGETLLVHGGSSGIGTTAIQCARLWGVRVFATASTPEKCALCTALGATAIQYTAEDYVTVIKEATENKGADVILDMVGGEYMARNMKAAAVDGRIVQIAFLQGASAELSLGPLLMKRLSWYGSTLRSLPLAQKSAIVSAMETHLWPAFTEGQLQPQIDRHFPVTEAEAAHSYMHSGALLGKTVLDMP